MEKANVLIDKAQQVARYLGVPEKPNDWFESNPPYPDLHTKTYAPNPLQDVIETLSEQAGWVDAFAFRNVRKAMNATKDLDYQANQLLVRLAFIAQHPEEFCHDRDVKFVDLDGGMAIPVTDPELIQWKKDKLALRNTRAEAEEKINELYGGTAIGEEENGGPVVGVTEDVGNEAEFAKKRREMEPGKPARSANFEKQYQALLRKNEKILEEKKAAKLVLLNKIKQQAERTQELVLEHQERMKLKHQLQQDAIASRKLQERMKKGQSQSKAVLSQSKNGFTLPPEKLFDSMQHSPSHKDRVMREMGKIFLVENLKKNLAFGIHKTIPELDLSGQPLALMSEQTGSAGQEDGEHTGDNDYDKEAVDPEALDFFKRIKRRAKGVLENLYDHMNAAKKRLGLHTDGKSDKLDFNGNHSRMESIVNALIQGFPAQGYLKRRQFRMKQHSMRLKLARKELMEYKEWLALKLKHTPEWESSSFATPSDQMQALFDDASIVNRYEKLQCSTSKLRVAVSENVRFGSERDSVGAYCFVGDPNDDGNNSHHSIPLVRLKRFQPLTKEVEGELINGPTMGAKNEDLRGSTKLYSYSKLHNCMSPAQYECKYDAFKQMSAILNAGIKKLLPNGIPVEGEEKGRKETIKLESYFPHQQLLDRWMAWKKRQYAGAVKGIAQTSSGFLQVWPAKTGSGMDKEEAPAFSLTTSDDGEETAPALTAETSSNSSRTRMGNGLDLLKLLSVRGDVKSPRRISMFYADATPSSSSGNTLHGNPHKTSFIRRYPRLYVPGRKEALETIQPYTHADVVQWDIDRVMSKGGEFHGSSSTGADSSDAENINENYNPLENRNTGLMSPKAHQHYVESFQQFDGEKFPIVLPDWVEKRIAQHRWKKDAEQLEAARVAAVAQVKGEMVKK